MPLNEADTRVRLIEPKLVAAGWTGSQVTREHYYHRDRAYTAGRITLRGTQARRGTPRRVDYLLRYSDAFPIAVIEAKTEREGAVTGVRLPRARVGGDARQTGVQSTPGGETGAAAVASCHLDAGNHSTDGSGVQPFVAALPDAALIAYIHPGSKTAELAQEVAA